MQFLEHYFFEIFDAFGDGICCGFGNGYYTLTTDDDTVIVDGGDFGSSEATELGIEGALGISDILAQNVIMFPNPLRNVLNINIGANSGSDFEYSIVNILGQNVGSGMLDEGENTINMGHVSSGLYFVTIRDAKSNEFIFNKLIKE